LSDLPIPSYRDLLFPTLQVLDASTGSLSKRELDSEVIDRLGITDEQLAVMYPDGATAKGSKVLHRLAFARSSLKLFGAVDNSVRGVWSITPRGKELLADGDGAVRRADSAMRQELARKRKEVPTSVSEPPDVEREDDESAAEEETWRAELLEAVQALTPRGFERLCAQLLREAGCEEVTVTAYSGDEGVDGVGLLRVGLLSFPVYFQAKKYSGSIGPEKVRELRGALAGRADKGILITTGRFSRKAVEEASRAGAPIDLIDGERLTELLLQYELGVRIRPVVDPGRLDALNA
jgi:restriction system protein